MSELRKPFKKNQNKNIRNKQKINVKMPHVNKKTTSEKWKFNSNKKLGLEWAVNWLGKPFRKNLIQKIEKTVKIRVKLPHVNKKTTTEKPNFCSNTIFSLYFKIRAKKSRRKTTRFFAPFPVSAWPKSVLQFDFKNHEIMCEQILKKNIAGRIPETTRSENLFIRHPTTHQKKLASTNLWFSRQKP